MRMLNMTAMTRSIIHPSHMKYDGQWMSCTLSPSFMDAENWSPQVRSLRYNSVTLHFHDCCKISIVVIHWYVFLLWIQMCVCGTKHVKQIVKSALRYLVLQRFFSVNPHKRDKTCLHVTTKAGQIGTRFYFQFIFAWFQVMKHQTSVINPW